MMDVVEKRDGRSLLDRCWLFDDWFLEDWESTRVKMGSNRIEKTQVELKRLKSN
jgi:hypothetical protein